MRMSVSKCSFIVNTSFYRSFLGAMTLEELEKQQKEADAVLGASDADNCSYAKGSEYKAQNGLS